MKLKGIIILVRVYRVNNIVGVSGIRNRRIKSAAVDRDTASAINQNNAAIRAAKRTAIHGKAASIVNKNCMLYAHY